MNCTLGQLHFFLNVHGLGQIPLDILLGHVLGAHRLRTVGLGKQCLDFVAYFQLYLVLDFVSKGKLLGDKFVLNPEELLDR